MSTLSIRPLREEDIPSLVSYWFENSEANLIRMGADKTKLISETEFVKTLQTYCNTPLDKVSTQYMIWLIDNKTVGHSALKDILKDEIGHMHLHMWNADYRGKGYGARLFCMSAVEFYKQFNLKMILCEPRSCNLMPNKMLTKVGFKKWKTYHSTASELSLTCELNSYVIDLNTATLYLNK